MRNITQFAHRSVVSFPKADSASLLLGSLVTTLIEFINTSAAVYEFLLACEKGMALGADINSHIALGRLSYESFAACASYRNFFILRMNSFLHY